MRISCRLLLLTIEEKRSCSLCRRRKIRCNREIPCSNCVRSKTETCVYDNLSSQHPQQRLSHGQAIEHGLSQEPREPRFSVPIDRDSSISRASTTPSHTSKSFAVCSTSVSALPSQSTSEDVESLKSRIRQLEVQLSEKTQKSNLSSSPNSNPNVETITSRVASSHITGTFHVLNQSHLPGQGQTITRGVAHKTRLFGQSHWVNGIALVSSYANHRVSFDKHVV